jgi:hypothetical protein
MAGKDRRRQARAGWQAWTGDSRQGQEMAGKRAHQRSSHVTLTPVLSDYKDSRIDLTNETESTRPDTELLLFDLTLGHRRRKKLSYCLH